MPRDHVEEQVEVESDVVRMLRKVKSFINTPEKWTKGTQFRGAHGGILTTHLGSQHGVPEGTVSMCFDGAQIAAGVYAYPRIPIKIQQAFVRVVNMDPVSYNDTHTHGDMMDAIDRTIAYLKQF